MTKNPFEDPFTNPGSDAVGLDTMSPAVPRRVIPTMEEQLDEPQAAQTPLELPTLSTGEDDAEDLPQGVTPVVDDPNLLSKPMDDRGPTAFQQKKINWADGGEDLSRPRVQEAAPADWLEVDYQFGKKEGATGKPVEAANVFGRQFTAEELMQDDEGRKLLDLMNVRRAGTLNEGGTLKNFAKGWGNWSKSDIPFYGWMSDLGTSAAEAVEMSRTIRKLQDGEKVSAHEAIAVRRFMLQQELESTRTMAYEVGSVVRQAVPFMAEMAASSAIGAAIGSVVPGIGTAIGGAGGAVVGGLKWLFTGGKVAAKAASRKLVTSGTKALAQKMASGAVLSSVERRTLRSAASDLFGKEIGKTVLAEARKELGEGATRKAMRDLAMKKIAGRVAEADVAPTASRMAVNRLVEADVANAVSSGAHEALRKYALQFAKYQPAKDASVRQIDRAVREGLANRISEKGLDFVRKELQANCRNFSTELVKKIGSGEGAQSAVQAIEQSLLKVTGSESVEKRFLESLTKTIVDDAAKNFELRYGKRGFVNGAERLLNYGKSHFLRGLMQSEHSFIVGGSPTIAHGGFGTFNRAWDAVAEGLGRVMIQAPIQAGIQLGVQTPLYFGAKAVNGDVTVRGQLGEQINALMSGDRDRMDHAHMTAIGQVFAEYWSENSGRGLAPLLGGTVAGIAGKSPAQLMKAVSGARDAFITPLSRATGDAVSKAVEAVFGFKDIRKMSLQRVADIAERYVKDTAIKGATKADLLKIAQTKSLDGIGAGLLQSLKAKGITDAPTFIKKSIGHMEDMTRGRAGRAFIGYWLMQKGVTPDRIVRAFRQMGKGGGIIEEMGEERFGDFIKGLMHVDDSASDAELLSSERLKNMFGGWVDGRQLATEFLGFAAPGIARNATIRLQSWMGQGAMKQCVNDGQTIRRIMDAARTNQAPVLQVEEPSSASADEIAVSAVKTVPFAGPNNSATAEQEANARGKAPDMQLVGSDAREEMTDALEGFATRLGRANVELEPRMSWGRRALTRIAGLPAALATGDFSFMTANPAAWAAADTGVPLQMQEAAVNAYNQSLIHGYRKLEGELHEELRKKFNEAIASKGNIATAISDMNLDTATLRRIEEAGADYRREVLSSVAQEFLSASGVLHIAQSDLSKPAQDLVDSGKAADLEDAKKQIIDGAIRIVQDQNAAFYSSRGKPGRSGYTMSVDAMRAVQNGTSQEVFSAIMQLPAFKGVAGVVNVSDNAEHSMSAIEALGRKVSAGRIASIVPGADGRLSEGDLAEVMSAMGRRADMYDEETNQKAALSWIEQIKLMTEGSMTTFSDNDPDTDRTATILPVMDGTTRSWVIRITNADGTVRTSTAASYQQAKEAVEAENFTADDKEIIITNTREVVSNDATSMVYFMYGNDQAMLRRAYLRELGGQEAVDRDDKGLPAEVVGEAKLPPFIRKTFATQADGRVTGAFQYTAEEAAAQFRTEKADANSMFAAYEKTGTSILDSLGVTRQATAAMEAMGTGADTFVCRIDGGFHHNALIIAPDFASNGDSEAMLRSAIKLALNTSVSSMDAGNAGRRQLLSQIYTEFAAARDRVLTQLKKEDTAKHDQLKAVMDRMFPTRTGSVSTDCLAMIVSSSAFFSAERGLRQEGNGFFGSPELAAVADEFRASEAYPLLLSAVDEILGGNGFFTREASSVNGLARYLSVFGADPKTLMDARNAAVFNPANSQGKMNPYLVKYAYKNGEFSIEKDADGDTVRAEKFDGNLAAGYIKAIADNCHAIANQVADEKGLPKDRGYTTAEMYTLMKNAGMFAGETRASEGEAPAPMVELRAGDIVTTEAGRRALDMGAKLRDLPTMDVDTARHIGLALRNAMRVAGFGLTDGLQTAVRYMRDRGIPEENVQQIVNGYSSIEVSNEEVEENAPSELDRREDDLASGDGTDGTDKMDHESNIKQWDSNADVRAVSNVVKWFFNLEGGDVSALFVRLRDTIKNLPLDSFNTRDAEQVRKFAEIMNPFANPDKATEAIEKSEAEFFSALGGEEEVTAVLDTVISAFVHHNMFAHAIAFSAIRELPHPQKGDKKKKGSNRMKVLRMMAQLTPVGSMEIRRSGEEPFTLRYRANPRNSTRSIAAFQSMYTSLLSTPLFARAGFRDWAKTAEDFGTRISLIESVFQSIKLGDESGVRLRIKNEVLNHLGFSYDVFADAVKAIQAIGPSEDNLVKNGNFVIYAVDAKDFAILGFLDPAGNARLRSGIKPKALSKALNNIQNLTIRRMEAIAKAVDVLLGPGSDAAALLRMHDSIALKRRQLEKAILTRSDYAQSYLVQFLDLTNEFAAVPSAGFKASNSGSKTLRPCSRFLYETVYEPISGLGRRLTGDSSEKAMKSEEAKRWAENTGIPNGWYKNDEKGRAAAMANYARDVHMSRGFGKNGEVYKARAARYAEALKGEENIAEMLRDMLANMAKGKYLTNQDLAAGISAEDARAAFSEKHNPNQKRTPDNLRSLIDLHMDAMPRNSARMGVKPKNAIEGAENRTITTLPSQIPAFLRACNSPLFHFDGLEQLRENGLRWADGSNPVIAILGCEDNGNLVDRMHLAGIANQTIIDQMARVGTTDSIVIPLFRGDKSSMYALQVPSSVAVNWVKSIADGSAKIKVNEKVRERINYLMSNVKNLDSLLTYELKNKNLGLQDVLDMIERDGLGSLKGRDADEMYDKKAMYLRAEFYSAVYGLVAQACGQDKIDPKRVAVNLSIGPIIPMCNFRGRDVEGEPKVGYYRTTIVGGASGSAMMGGWFMHGSAANAIAAMAEGGEAQAVKVHVYELEDRDDIEFDKGQAHDYGLGIEDDEEVSPHASIRWWQAQMRKRVCLALGLKPDALERPEVPEIKDPTSIDGMTAQRKYDEKLSDFNVARTLAREFCKRSTFGVDDMETHKAGAFGSRCGFAVPSGAKEIRLGKNLLFVKRGDDWVASKEVTDKFPALDGFKIEVKNGAAPLMGVLSAYAAINGDLEAEKVAEIEPKYVDEKGEEHDVGWQKADGTVAHGAFGKAGILSKKATLAIRQVDGAMAVDYFTRSMICQSVANNSSPSTVKNGHSFATNLTRDVQVDELLIQALNGVAENMRKTSFVDAHTGYAMLQLGQLIANPSLMWEAIAADEDMAAQVRKFINDREVRDTVYEKLKAYIAKQIIPSYHGNHGVMVASGIKATCYRFDHNADFEYAPGMDDYTKDCYRPAVVYNTAMKNAMGMSRSYASGCVNVKQIGFRYGMYMNEEKFDAFASKYLAEQMKSADATADLKRLTDGGISDTDARRMVAVRFAVEAIRDGKLEHDAYNDFFGNCFTDFTGKSAWHAYYKEVRFDDLFDRGRFDYAALECGDTARTGRDGKKHFYVGGSFFAAHRSPSGNIEAFSGLVRAVAPVTYDPKTFAPGKESKYALDPVTTNTQGSDTDGDSSGIQVFDYTLQSNPKATPRSIRQFTDAVTEFDGDVFARAKRAMELAKANGWTMTDENGREVVDPNVLLLLERALFVAQVDNYRRSPTFHQGYVGESIANSKRKNGTTDIVDGDEIANAAGRIVYDTGFAGRAPVGTDAVWEEPITKEQYDAIPQDVKGLIPSWEKISKWEEKDRTWQNLFNKTIGGAKLDLVDPFSAANLSNAASDSADARGVSVFQQSRFLRALSENVNVEQGNFKGTKVNMNAAIGAVRPDGYSPVIDLTSHFDNISNNLFDTLKKMFATRAGWTKDLLKVVMARLVRHAATEVKSNPNFRLDNRFFAIELIRFFGEKNKGGEDGVESPVHRFLRYNDPVNGRSELVNDIFVASREASGLEGNTILDAIKKYDEKYPNGQGAPTRAAQCVKVLRTLLNPRTTVAEIALAAVKERHPEVRIQDALVNFVGYFGSDIAYRKRTELEEAFVQDILNSTAAIVESLGDITDFPKLSGKPFSKLTRTLNSVERVVYGSHRVNGVQTRDRKNAFTLSSATNRQAAVSDMLVHYLLSGFENEELIVRDLVSESKAYVYRNHLNVDTSKINEAEVGANYEKLVHLFGAYKKLDAVTGGRANITIKLCGATTADFIRNVAAAVSRYANQELAVATGRRGKQDSDLIRNLFASLEANDSVIRLADRSSSKNIETLRLGFDRLCRATRKFEVNGHEFTGREFARILMVHACCTTSFSAMSDYASQSTFPAVFGDAMIADMDAFSYAVEGNDAAELYFNPTVSVGDKKYSVSRIYDIVSNLEHLADVSEKFTDPSDGGALARHFMQAIRTEVKLDDTVPAVAIEKRDLPVNIDSTSPLCRPYVTAHRFTEFAFPTLNADGSLDTKACFRSAEDALNEWMSQMHDRLDKSFDAIEARKFFDATGKYWLETGVCGRDQSVYNAAKSIVGWAVRHSPQVYGMIEAAGDSLIRTSDVQSPLTDALDSAFAAAQRQILAGKIQCPTLPPAEVGVVGGGESAKIDPSSVIRANYMKAVEDLYPEFERVTAEQMKKSVPDAIEAAFKRIFGDSVTVTKVLNDRGEPTNLLRVERKLGESGKTVITHIAYGESIAKEYSRRVNDRRSFESIVNGINAAHPEAHLDAEELLALPENERRMFLAMADKHLEFKGVSASPFTTYGKQYYPTDFSGAMSGLIRLNLNAGFQTLFHEYFHSMLSCYKHLGICTAEDEALLRSAFSAEHDWDTSKRYEIGTVVRVGEDEYVLTDHVLNPGDPAREFHEPLWKNTKTGAKADPRTFSFFHARVREFNEEDAANAYSQYLTRLDAAGGNSVRLRDYYREDGQIDERIVDMFDKFRTRAELIAEATVRGADEHGLPVFVRCTFVENDPEVLERISKADPVQVEQIETLILQKSSHDREDFGIPIVRTHDSEMAMDAAWNAVIRGGAAGKMSEKMKELMAKVNAPSPTRLPEISTKPEPIPVKPVDAFSGLSPVGKVSMFLKEAAGRFSKDRLTYAEIDEDLANMRKAEANADTIGETVGAQRALFGARRLIRETAAALGIETETVDRDGNVVLTEDGKELFANGTVAELALRLIHASGEERKEENAAYELGAKEAGADFTFGRALKLIAPSSYYNFSMKLAMRSRDLFASAERRALDAANAARDAGDAAKEAKYRRMASELAAQAIRVMEYTRIVASGQDAHFLFPKNKNTGNLHGLLFITFSGGAKFADVGSSDGIRRYKANGQFDFSFDLSDPTIQLAYDLANQAFFTSEAARKFEAGDYHGDRFDEINEEIAKVNPAEKPDEPLPPIPADIDFDMGQSAPHWILSNPGSWLASDMQKDFASVSLREMMTDHSVQAATESAYNFATTCLQFFGCDCYAGDKLRLMEQVKSSLVKNKNGDMAYAEGQGADILRFSHTTGILFGAINFGAKRVGKPMTAEDLQLVNIALQAVRGMVGGDKALVTDIGLGYLVSEIAKLTAADAASYYSPERVMYRIRHSGKVVDGKRVDLASHLDKALSRLLVALPRQIVGADCMSERDSRGVVEFKDTYGTSGVYHDVVETLIAAAALARKERNVKDSSRIMEDAIVKSGLAVKGAKGINLALPMDYVRDAWNASKKDGAYAKLRDANRPENMLDLDYWVTEFAKETTKLNKVAAKSSFLRNGSGTTLTLAGTPNFWFHGGSGAHMLDVQRYRTAIEMLRDMTPSKSEDIERNNQGLVDTLSAIGKHLDAPAFKDGAALVSDAQMLYLADLCGINTTAGSGFSLPDFIRDIVRGEYAGGQRVPGVDLDANSTKFDLALAINRLVNDKIVTEANATALTRGDRQRLADLRVLNERLADKLANSVPGRILAKSDMQVFQQTGEVGTSWTAAESLLQMTKELVAAERYRGCMAQMLTSVAADGSCNYIVNPSDYAANVDRMPDEYWGALARFAIQRWNGPADQMVAYDQSLTGVENMKAVYRAYEANAKGSYKAMTEKDAKIKPLFEGMLCRKTDVDNAGNVNDLTLTQGGEAMAYMKQLLGAVGSSQPGTFMKQAERLMAWTKLASVGFSSFFQIATAFESQTAATGFTQAFLGNLPGKLGAKLGRAVGRKLGREGGLGGFQADALSFKDIIENINSNDPFMIQARELCDLIGMPLDQSVDPFLSQNESNPGLGQGSLVKQDIERIYRTMSRFGIRGAQRMKSFLYFCYQHPTDYTFNVVLNGVKLAVVAQTMRRLREECLQGERPFDPVMELRKHAAYMNAEIGGIDPARYAWATPQMQRILRMGMFSWQWTVGAWIAGSGEVVSDALFGGHSTTAASRQYAFIRWMRMLGIVKFGVPLVLQMGVKLLAKAAGCMLPPPDDEDEEETPDERKVPWMMWNNESKAGSLSFDITPLLKLSARVPGVKALKEADIPMVSALIPAYVGGGRNTTGKRRYYMHFGKQSDEFFRWFTDPVSQMVSKTSIPGQKLLEGLFGKVSPNGYSKPFAELDFFERWFNTNLTADNNAFVNLGQMFLPFSWQGAKGNADAGLLAAVGPMKMGQSKRSTRLRIVERLNEFVNDTRSNDPWAYRKNRKKLNLMCTDILREAQLNGVDPAEIMTSALGDVAHVQYLKLMDALPFDANSKEIDARKAMEAIRALTIINRKAIDIKNSVVQKYKAAGTDAKKNPYFYAATRDLIRSTQAAPFADDREMQERFGKWFATTDDKSMRMAAKGGDVLGNFLATDEVPDTLFGVRIVRDNYTATDLEFFREHPEAGGYYDTDEEPEPPAPPPPATPRESPDGSTGGLLAGVTKALKERVGAAGEVADAGIAWMERQAKQTADMKVPVLSKAADAVVQPMLVGARAAIANATSGGGKYYQPEVRDERYFSNDALRELGATVKGMHGRTSGRADGMDNAAQFGLTQTVGGFTVQNGKITDNFDINKSYHGVPQVMTDVARRILGTEEASNAGKVRTAIPLSALRQDAKGGNAEDELVGRINTAIDQAIPFIKEHEGFRDKAYQDSVGKWTIGYGQTEIDGRPVREGDVIDEPTASEFVARRVRSNAVDIYKNSSWTNNASANALSALYDLAYNMGVGALSEKKSPTLNRTGKAATTTNDVDAAIWAQVPTYVKAGGKVLKGLKNRRQDAIDKWRK